MAIAPHPAEKKAPARRTSGRWVFYRLQVKGARHAPDSSYSRLSKTPRRVRGPQAANRVPSIFRGGAPQGDFRWACTSRKILCAERVCPNGLKAHLDARVGARFFCQKRVSPFFDKFRKNPRLARGFSLFFWRVLWYTFRRQGPDLSKRRKAFVRPGGAVL